MTIVLTRPREDSEMLARQLQAQGFFCLIEPMLNIEYATQHLPELEAALNAKPQAIIVTSRHALVVLAHCKQAFTIPLIAVGKSSAEQALALGFTHVSYAGGSAELLASYITGHCSADKGNILYAHGEHIYYDLEKHLQEAGFSVDSHMLYYAHAISGFSTTLLNALHARTVEAVVFYSTRTAQIYETLAHMHGLLEEHRNSMAICLSQNIADNLHLLPWQKVYTDISNIPHYIAQKDSTQNL